MNPPPEGDRPGRDEPFEGVPPERLDRPEGAEGDLPAPDLPDLEPEFVQALEAASEAEQIEPTEEHETAAAAEPDGQEPEDPAPPSEQDGADEGPGDTVEFTPEQLSEAEEASDNEGEPEPGERAEEPKEIGADGKPRRTVVIGAGP